MSFEIEIKDKIIIFTTDNSNYKEILDSAVSEYTKGKPFLELAYFQSRIIMTDLSGDLKNDFSKFQTLIRDSKINTLLNER